MPNFSANLSMLFQELPFLDRFSAAASAGFRGVEYMDPYNDCPQCIGELLDRHGLIQVLFNLPSGEWSEGERGIAILPDRISEFQEGVEKAVTYARVLGCKQVNCLAGISPENAELNVLEKTLIENLRFAADRLRSVGARVLVEAVNDKDIPGFFLTGTEQTLDLLEKVRSQNVFMQYDVYHMQIMEGDITATLRANLARISHIQVADNPGRHEPGTGEINFPFVFDELDRLGYTGWIGAEYRPATNTMESLNWLQEYTHNVVQ